MITVELAGTGALGDSVIIASKLLNIVDGLPTNSEIIYHHYESDNKSLYMNVLTEFWDIVKRYLDSSHSFSFEVSFYPKGQIKEILHTLFNRGMTILTTKVDSLCSKVFPKIVTPAKNDIVVVMDAGDRERGFVDGEVEKVAKKLNREVTLLGVDRRSVDADNITNLTGKTSLAKAFSYILGSNMVLAPDGALGYLAYIGNIPNIIYFHAPNLRENYWNKSLRPNSSGINSGSKIIISTGVIKHVEAF